MLEREVAVTPDEAARDALPLDAAETTVAAPPAVVQDEERISVASQRQLMWWRLRKHKLALVAAVVIGFFYVVVIFGDFFAYADPNASEAQRSLIPPQSVRWDGLQPYVHPLEGTRDPTTFQREYVENTSERVNIRLFGHGYEWKVLGLFTTDLHLIGVDGRSPESTLFLLGTDKLGRDVFSRVVFATRTSLTIGLAAVAMSLFLGVVLGAISGYYGGYVDAAIQRLIEIVRSIPVIPLWMGLAAAMPRDWSVQKVYFALTIILSLIGWTELARVVRGRFLQLREEDFVMAAELAGARPRRIIFVHMVPLFASHIIAATTLALPTMIIAETSLSFLGLGLRPPAISWGVMLQDAQNVQTVALNWWLMIPVIPVVLAILAFNFLGDGLRDAADPYHA